MLREIRAGNASAMTLDGTRTYVVGERRVAIIDPGPDAATHLDAIVEAVRMSESAEILLTHAHPDHAAGAPALAGRIDAVIRSFAGGNLHEGDTVPTDAGDLLTLHTPGHTPDHASFWLDARRAAFCGDLMMGGLDTALIAPPEGNLRQYLESLERIRGLGASRIIPAHGPPFDDPDAAITRYAGHRMQRVRQVADVLGAEGPLSTRQVADRVYGGEVPEDLREVAVSAVVAYLEYLEAVGRVTRTGSLWRLQGG